MIRFGTLFPLLIAFAGFAMADPSTQPAVSPSMQSYMAHIAAAHSALRLNESSSARRWLESAPEQHRRWEWKYLNAKLDQSLGVVGQHDQPVFALAIAPDGRQIASATGTRVQIQDAASGKHVGELNGHEGAIFGVAFSPDGKRIASASADRTVRLWTLASGRCDVILKDFNTPVTSVAFTPDGAMVAACNYTASNEAPRVDGTMKLWDAATGSLIADMRGGGVKPLSCVRIAPDGKSAVAGSWDGEIWIFDLSTQKVARCIKLPDEGVYNAVNAIDLSPDGKRVVSGAKDDAARVYDLSSGELLHTLRHDGWVTAVTFSPDGKSIVTASMDELVRIWNSSTGRLTATLRGHRAGGLAAAISPDSRSIYSAAQDGKIRKWDAAWPFYGGVKFTGPAGTYGLGMSPDGRWLLANAYDTTIRKYDLRTAREIAQVKAHEGSSNMMSLSADGKRAVSCSWDKTLKIWNAETLELEREIRLESAAYHCAISADGSLAGGALGDKSAVIYRTSDGALLHTLNGHEKGLHSIAFAADAKRVVTGSTDKTARIWSLADGSCVQVLAGHEGAVESAVFSPDGAMVVTAGADGRVIGWDAATGAMRWSNRIANQSVNRVSFSPDGARIAAAADAICLIDTLTGALVLRFKEFNASPYNLLFSRDGSMLVSCASEGDIAISHTLPAAELINNTKKEP